MSTEKQRAQWRIRNAKYRATEKGRIAQQRAEAKRRGTRSAQFRAYRQANPALFAYHAAMRRREVKRATQAWCDREQVRMWYEVAATLSRSGVRFEVDHIVPIKAREACGLHTHDNLQVLPAHLNQAKRNRLQGGQN